MSQTRLPPLQLNSPRSDSSNNEESSAQYSGSARERRHKRILDKQQQQQQQQNDSLNLSQRDLSSNEGPRRTRRSRSEPKENNENGHDNSGYVKEVCSSLIYFILKFFFNLILILRLKKNFFNILKIKIIF